MTSYEIDRILVEEPPRAPERTDAFLQNDGLFGRRGATFERMVVLAIVVLAAVVRLGPLQRGLGFDELFTAIHFVQTDTIWQPATTWLTFNNHIAYSLLARLSVGVFGMREWAL